MKIRSSHGKRFFKKVNLKNFAIFTGKDPWWSLFLTGIELCWSPFLKGTTTQVFFGECCEIFKKISERLLLEDFALIEQAQCSLQKQLSVSVFMKMCSENTQQIYRRTPMPKCDFIPQACSPVNLLLIFRKAFPKTTSGELLPSLGVLH